MLTDLQRLCPNGKRYQEWDLGRKWVNVGSAHVNTSKVKAKFTYQSGAHSTLGVGFSLSGKAGSFEASGTNTRESSATISWPWYDGVSSYHLDTQFRYVKYCVAHPDHAGGYHYYEVTANHHAGGTRKRDAKVPSTPKDYCARYDKGSDHVADKTNAITREAGAKLADDIGINLSSRTGFRQNARLVFDFGKKARLCGTHGDPANGSPRVLVARSL